MTLKSKAKIACSVLIRTFNSAGTLEAVLKRLEISDLDEIIIIDSGSTDETPQIAEKFGAYFHCVDRPFNYSRSLNIGFAKAVNPWVVVLSSHCIPENGNLMSKIKESISQASSEVVVIYGQCLLFVENDSAETNVEYDLNDLCAMKIKGGNGFAVYQKMAWQAKSFNENILTAEDLEWLKFQLQQGRKACVDNRLIVFYRNRGSLLYMFRKGWIECVMGKSLMWQMPEFKKGVRCALGFFAFAVKIIKICAEGKIDFSAAVRAIAQSAGAAVAASLFEFDLYKIPRFDDQVNNAETSMNLKDK